MSQESAYPLAKHWFSHSGDVLPLSLTCLGVSTDLMLTEIVEPYMTPWQHLDLDTSMFSLDSIYHDNSFALLEALTLRVDLDTPLFSLVIDALSLRRLS